MRSLTVRAAIGAAFLAACGGTTVGGTADGGGDDGGGTCTVGPAAVLRTSTIEKIDLLFMIDNSASMGDKQDYVRKAIPDLIGRFVHPNCLDAGKIVGRTDASGACASGHPEFPPVHDMHIGVVTSALGPRLGDVCNPTERAPSGLLKHNDDRGHLVNRAGDDEHAIAAMAPSNFLAWFPDVPANAGRSAGAGATPIKNVSELELDFADLVAGVHQLGCGLESQLESWYRFLIQPDPYDRLERPNGRAQWVDVDGTIIAQRHDFLRPDSAVAIIDVTDENDSEIDVRALGQQGWNFNASGFQPPKGTSACNANPGDPSCTSCLLAPNRGAGDPNCASPYSAQNDWGYNLNLRHVHMKQKYGIDVQFPMSRYKAGLSSQKVPNRDGEYPSGAANYVGNANCTNPLFAGRLPDGTSLDPAALCNLPIGSRTPDLVFYAHIGGVPHQLLHFVPGDPAASRLTDADWTKILGRDPSRFDYSGIDPHMIESVAPRPGLPMPSLTDDTDPISGREWITSSQSNYVDLQYACTFPLAQPRDCSLVSNADICDCPAGPGQLTHDQTPPVCGSTVTQQVKAKAYPTIREIQLAQMLGAQGVLSSICPIDVNDDPSGSDPLYGYRPAVTAIADRMSSVLANLCLPQALPQDASGQVTCSVIEVLPSRSCASGGLVDAPAAVAASVRRELAGSIAPDSSVCALPQLGAGDLVNGSCVASSSPGWCYVTGAAAGACPQTIQFSSGGRPLNGAIVTLQCGATCSK